MNAVFPIDPRVLDDIVAKLARKDLLGAIQTVRLQSDLSAFMKYEGEGRWQPEPFLKFLCRKLEDVANGLCKRLMVFMPPRHGKSQIISKKFPAWYLGQNPSHSIIMASYSADLAFEFSQIARDTLRDNLSFFPGVELDPSASSKARWKLTGYDDSGMVAAGVGGPITGRGANIGIIDDPVKNYEEAQSETTREAVWQWYKSTFRTRLAPNGSIVIILTRWHEDDLAGRLLQEAEQGTGEQWEVISFPAIAEDSTDILGRQKGESLSPRFPLSELEVLRKTLGPSLFAALYQQRPRAEEGNFFHKSWFVDLGLPVDMAWQAYRGSIFAAMDPSISEKEVNDWCVIAVGAKTQFDELIPIEIRRFRPSSADEASFDIAAQVLDIQKTYRPCLFGMEDGQIYKAVWPVINLMAQRKRLLINSQPMTPIRDKVTRARTLQSMMRAGKVLFPKTAYWYETLEEEMLGFPNAKWDDQVDAMAWLALLVNEYETSIFSNLNMLKR